MPPQAPKTPLEEAAANGDLEQLQKLIADEPRTEKIIQDLLIAASRKSQLNVVEYLLSHYAPTELDVEVVRVAAFAHSLPLFSALMSRYPSIVNTRFDSQGTPLTISLMGRCSEAFITHLLDSGADVNEDPRIWGEQPLAAAAAVYNDPVFVDLLLQRGARIEGSGCLEYAAMRENLTTLRHLLECGARPETDSPPYNQCEGAVQMAAKGGSVEAVRILLEFGADVSARNRAGKTALEVAEETERKEGCDLSEVKRLLSSAL